MCTTVKSLQSNIAKCQQYRIDSALLSIYYGTRYQMLLWNQYKHTLSNIIFNINRPVV